MTKRMFGRKLFGVWVWFGPNGWQGAAILLLVAGAIAIALDLISR